MRIHNFNTTRAILLFVVFAVIACNNNGSDVEELAAGNRKSPISISSIKYEGTYIKVVYGQPYRRGRTIFGELEPYGQVWRTGANEATEITFTKPVFMGDEVILAGTYALFTIPFENHWTIILNNDLGQWGAFEYNEQLDYLRFDVPIEILDSPVEAFTIEFSEPLLNQTIMTLKWDLVSADIPIRFYGE